LSTATERPGARFISWVADDEERVEQVLAFGREQGFTGPVAKWTEGQLKAAHAYLQARRRPGPEVESVTTSDPASFGIRSGKDLFFWLKDRSHEHGIALLDYVADWGRSQGYPVRMWDWDLTQVALGLAAAQAKLGEVLAPAPLESVTSPAPEVESVTTPPADRVEGKTTLEFCREKLYEQALAIAAIQYPGRRLTGKDIAQVCSGLTKLDPAHRKLATIRGCMDVDLLVEFNSLACEQLARLQASQPPSLPMPMAAAEPTLFGPAEEDAA
jgi:hypothetical protein